MAIRFISLLIITLLSSCSYVNGTVGTYLDFETDLKLRIIADKNINPDEASESSPIFIRLYELKSNKLIERADFLSLYESDKEVLGDDLIAKQELKRIVPEEDRKESFVISKGVKYIALYAEFYNYKDSNYTIIFPVTENNLVRNYVKVRIIDNRLELIDE